MRPITNILLVLALICYLFLPFQDISLMGKVTGLGFTAGTISQSLSISNIVLALLPFLACFGAVALNCMKRRWWVLGTIACILLWLWFYSATGTSHDIFSVIGMGIGYKLSRILTWLSLISAAVSMLPFKFNETIEKAVDDTFEDGRRHVREEFKRLENAHKGKGHKGHKINGDNPSPSSAPEEKPETPDVEDKEDPSRFMPH